MKKIIDGIYVIDDCIPAELQNHFYSLIFGKLNSVEIFPLVDFKIKYEPTAKHNEHEPLSFMHILKSDAEVSPHLVNFSLIPQIICQHQHIRLQNLIYARIFLTMPDNTDLTHHTPHTDLPYPHLSLIYYVNNATGGTVFFKEDEIIESVTPKKGRAVLFDGSIMHGAGIPDNGPRCIVNYNLLV